MAAAAARLAAGPQPPAPPHRLRGSSQQQQRPPGYLVSTVNQHVQPLEQPAPPLRLGPTLQLAVPLLAAPLAGVTAAPLRLMYTEAGASLAVSEMVVASTLRSGSAASRRLASFHPREALRSVQLYGVRPDTIEWAVRHLVQHCGVAHVDLNFGCPVRKVTSRGGGSALPLRPRLFRRLVAAAVGAADGVPVTVKLRMGLSPELLTFLEAGAIAADEGAAALVLHARTADQQYAPPAHWEAVRRLVQAVPRLPVVGNGDVFEAADAVRLVQETGCHAVMIGRAALGRPWLFAEAAAMLSGRWPDRPPPPLGSVLSLALHHVEQWAEWERDERSAVLKMRKLVPCYLCGFETARQLRGALFAARTVRDWQAALADPDRWAHDPSEPFPMAALRQARLKGHGRQGAARRRVVLPHGWLDADGDDGEVPEGMDESCCEG